MIITKKKQTYTPTHTQLAYMVKGIMCNQAYEQLNRKVKTPLNNMLLYGLHIIIYLCIKNLDIEDVNENQ